LEQIIWTFHFFPKYCLIAQEVSTCLYCSQWWTNVPLSWIIFIHLCQPKRWKIISFKNLLLVKLNIVLYVYRPLEFFFYDSTTHIFAQLALLIFLLLSFLVVWRIDPRAFYMLSKCSTTELHPQPFLLLGCKLSLWFTCI
jgi:hypothetical protein